MATPPTRFLLLVCSLSLAACEASDSDPAFDVDLGTSADADAFRRGSECYGPDEWSSPVIGELRRLDQPMGTVSNAAVETRRDGSGATAFYHRNWRLGTRELGLGDSDPSPYRRVMDGGNGVATASNGSLVVAASMFQPRDSSGYETAVFELYEDGETVGTAEWEVDRAFGLPGLAMDRHGNTLVLRTVYNDWPLPAAIVFRWLSSDGEWMGEPTRRILPYAVQFPGDLALNDDTGEIAVVVSEEYEAFHLQRYDSNFNEVGPEVELGQYWGSPMGQPNIAFLPDGAVVLGLSFQYPDWMSRLVRVEPDGTISEHTNLAVIPGTYGTGSVPAQTVLFRTLSMDVNAGGVIAVAGTFPDFSAPALQLFSADLEPLTSGMATAPPGLFSGTVPGLSFADCGPRLVMNWPHFFSNGPGFYADITPG